MGPKPGLRGPLRFLLLVLAAAALAGCGRRQTQVEIDDKAEIIDVGNLDEPTDLDPQIVDSDIDLNVNVALFEGLTAYDPKDLHPVPGVAERWESNADATVWTFHLRSTARWSDGAPVTANDFVYAYRRMLSPKLAAEYASFLFNLKNGEDYYNGKISDFGRVGAAAPDAHTLILTLWHPIPYFPYLACFPAWYPVPRAAIEKFGAMDERATAWTKPGNIVGNGPFILKVWSPNQVIRVVKSPTYWNRDSVRLQGCNFYPIQDSSTEEAAFRAGQLHVTIELPIDKIPSYRKDTSGILRESPMDGTCYYRLNVRKPPLNDRRVRQALSLSIDRDKIVNDVTKGGQRPAGNLVPPGTAGFESTSSIGMDVPQAQKLMADAGYPGGKGFPVLEILYNTNEGHRQIAESIQRMWHQNLGISVTLLNEDAKVQEESTREGNYTISRYAWVADYFDPSTFIDLLSSDNGNNQTGWSNAEYDRLDRLAAATVDTAKRYKYFQECEAILARESPIIPIYFYEKNGLARREVQGWYDNLLDIHPLNAVYLEPPK